LLTLVVLAVLGAGGYYGWQRWHNGDNATVAAVPPCPTTSQLPTALPSPASAGPPIRVLNGNLRAGLASRVARELRDRFRIEVGRVGNASRFVRGASEVHYPAQLQREALVVAAALVPAPILAVAPDTKVEVDLGTKFRRVATPAEHDGAFKQLLVEYTGASPSPSATPTPSATPCRAS
jgi:hypothetical protein